MNDWRALLLILPLCAITPAGLAQAPASGIRDTQTWRVPAPQAINQIPRWNMADPPAGQAAPAFPPSPANAVGGLGSGEAGLSAFYATPIYTLAPSCDLAQPLAFVNVVVANRGGAASAAATVSAFGADSVLAGDAVALPPLAARAQTSLRVPLRHMETSTAAIVGSHAVTLGLGLKRLAPIIVTIPYTLCGGVAVVPPVAAHAADATAVRERSTAQIVEGTPRGVSTIAHAGSPALNALIASRIVAVPTNVRIAHGAAECVQHIGLLGALLCPDLIRSGDMLVVWDWLPGRGRADVDGFRLYRIDGRRRLIDTRRNNGDVTLVDVPVPPGGYPGTCYAMSAYAQDVESPLSPALCPTRAQTQVAATPTVAPPPRPPKHVVIHITEDSFPMDTVVAAGGDVTWINDDGDEHDVVLAPEDEGFLEVKGARFTKTFRDIGETYPVRYGCDFHPGMIGRITVVKEP